MSYEYKDYFKELHFNESRKVGSDLNDRFNARDELNEVYAQAAKADEYEDNLNEFKEQLKIKIRHSREDGDYSEAYGFSKSLDMIENLI